ncbi:MAG: hypothetical protein WA858_19260 [Xanthobacteraceae bacterium]|jgi:hypothetical protein
MTLGDMIGGAFLSSSWPWLLILGLLILAYWTFIRGWLQKRQEKIKERDGYWEPHPTLGRTWVPPVPLQNLSTEEEARLQKRMDAIKANEASHDH